MKKLILFLVLLLFATWALFSTRSPDVLNEVHKKYSILRDNLPPGMEKLKKPIVITGFSKKYGEVGYNVSKGKEIGLCIDPGEDAVNKAFHVLIHELAHAVSNNYSHDEQFWKNFDTLKNRCIELGIYEAIPTREKYCGKYVKD